MSLQIRKVKKRVTSFVLVFACLVSLFAMCRSERAEGAVLGTATTVEEIHQYFPQSYWEGLETLLEAHPKWRFAAFDTGLSFERCFDEDAEMRLTRNLVYAYSTRDLWQVSSWYDTTMEGSYDWWGNQWVAFDSGRWLQASEEAVRYCMDPRNFFDEVQIFQFMDGSAAIERTIAVNAIYKLFQEEGGSYWTQSGRSANLYYVTQERNPVYTHYLSGDHHFSDPPEEFIEMRHYLSYAEALAMIGEELGINQIMLASRLLQEQGDGDSYLTSGIYPFELEDGTLIKGGYYNYFNINAQGNTTKEICTNGLRRAYEEGWDTRYKSLYGGSAVYRDVFLEQGQSTLYFQKFNVDASSDGLFWRQYMQNITAPQSEAEYLYDTLENVRGLDASLTFLIPVFYNMPETPCARPTEDGNPNYKLAEIAINGDPIPGFHYDVHQYKGVTFGRDQTSFSLSIMTLADTSDVEVYLSSMRPDSENYQGEAVELDFSTVWDEDYLRGLYTALVPVPIGLRYVTVNVTAENGDSTTYYFRIDKEEAASVVMTWSN